MNINEIGRRLVVARGNRSLESVSEETGISINSLIAYETGERIPSDSNKIKIAKAYKAEAETLFY